MVCRSEAPRAYPLSGALRARAGRRESRRRVCSSYLPEASETRACSRGPSRRPRLEALDWPSSEPIREVVSIHSKHASSPWRRDLRLQGGYLGVDLVLPVRQGAESPGRNRGNGEPEAGDDERDESAGA